MGKSYWLVKGRVSMRPLFSSDKKQLIVTLFQKRPLSLQFLREIVSEGCWGGEKTSVENKNYSIFLSPSEMFGFRSLSPSLSYTGSHLIFSSFDFFII